MKKTIRIGIDITSIITRKEIREETLQFSIAIFVADIIDGWIQNNLGTNITLFSYEWGREYLEKRFPGAKVESVGNTIIDKINRITGKNLYGLINTDKMVNRKINKSDVDIVWNPFVRKWKGTIAKPCISTVHDLIDYHVSDEEYTDDFRQCIFAANHLVAISQYVKDDCIKTFGINSKNISIIPNAIHLNSIEEEAISDSFGEYILDVNAYREHKNTISLIRAFSQIRDETNCNLVLCGGGKTEEYYSKVLDEIDKCGLKDRVKVLCRISERQLEWLYNHATLFVNPSLQEGFGRTPVEAILHGIPVLTTKETSLYEVTLGLLEYINDPLNCDEIASSIMKILHFGTSYNIADVKEAYIDQYNPQRIALLYWNTFIDHAQ